MATTIDQAFRQYASNLEITDRQAGLVRSRREAVVRALRAQISLYVPESLLIGSYDRQTLIRYLSEGDVDVMVILHYGINAVWDSPTGTEAALNRFKAVLDAAFPSVEKRRDRNCITMQYSEFRLDVVPAFSYANGSYYKIPDAVRHLWVSTNPIEFQAQLTRLNTTMSSMFIPMVKMVKGWNRNAGWPIRSFHLECMMLRWFTSNPSVSSYPSTLVRFFQALPILLGQESTDPVMGDRVDSYLDEGYPSRRQEAITKATNAAALAKSAEGMSYYAAYAIPEWKRLFGEFFPSYG